MVSGEQRHAPPPVFVSVVSKGFSFSVGGLESTFVGFLVSVDFTGDGRWGWVWVRGSNTPTESGEAQGAEFTEREEKREGGTRSRLYRILTRNSSVYLPVCQDKS